MRALCGAIITAGALIGLGLAALGLGTRYQHYAEREGVGGVLLYVPFRQMDTPLMYIVVFLTCVALIGLGIAFVGLAFHHERRHWERQQHLQRGPGPGPETGVRPLQSP